jgi:tetratricopeptide (TPR) repeat protein
MEDSPRKADLMLELAGLYQNSDPRQALAEAEKAGEFCSRLGYKAGRASATRMMGSIHEQLGDYPRAVSCGMQALALYRKLNDCRETARCLNNIGLAYTRMGALGAAMDFFQRALSSLEEEDDERIRAYVANNIGLTYRSLDNNHKALDYFRQSLDILERLGDRRNVAHALSNIGLCLRAKGETGEAMEHMKRSLAIRQEIGDRFSQVHSWINIANLHRDLGEYGQSYDCLMRAMDLAVDGGNAVMEVYVMTLLSKLKNLTGELDAALEYAEHALPLAEKLGDQNILRSLYQEFADNHEAEGDLEKALHFRLRYFKSLAELLATNIEEALSQPASPPPVGVDAGGQGIEIRRDQIESLKLKLENVCREFNLMVEHALSRLDARTETENPPDHLGNEEFPWLVARFAEPVGEGLKRTWEELRRLRLQLKKIS